MDTSIDFSDNIMLILADKTILRIHVYLGWDVADENRCLWLEELHFLIKYDILTENSDGDVFATSCWMKTGTVSVPVFCFTHEIVVSNLAEIVRWSWCRRRIRQICPGVVRSVLMSMSRQTSERLALLDTHFPRTDGHIVCTFFTHTNTCMSDI